MTTDLTTLKHNPFDAGNLVYIRRMADDEVRSVLPPNAVEELSDTDDLFILHDADGQRLGIVEGRDAAFAAARANSLQPYSVH